ncbi:hypothetical protein BASA81_006550 [Batrachochytrium salamandrivorans]|nr:hypothetical protein BASA81_006550 [Batrachochytrium salamandrivorans]
MEEGAKPVLRRSARTASIDATATLSEQMTPRKAKPVSEDAKPSSRKPRLEAIEEEVAVKPAKAATASKTKKSAATVAEDQEEVATKPTRKSTRTPKPVAVVEEEEEEEKKKAPKSTRKTRSGSLTETLEELPQPPKSTRRTRSNSVAAEDLEELPQKSARKVAVKVAPTIVEEEEEEQPVSALDLGRKSVDGREEEKVVANGHATPAPLSKSAKKSAQKAEKESASKALAVVAVQEEEPVAVQEEEPVAAVEVAVVVETASKSNKKTPKSAIKAPIVEEKEEHAAKTPAPLSKSAKKALQKKESANKNAVVVEEEEETVETPAPLSKSAKKALQKKESANKNVVAVVVEDKTPIAEEVPESNSHKKAKVDETPAPQSKSAKKALQKKESANKNVVAPVPTVVEEEAPKSNHKKAKVEETPLSKSAKKALGTSAAKSEVETTNEKPSKKRNSDAVASQILADLSSKDLCKRSTTLHRLKFVEFKPEGVEAFASNHESLLAVGRTSGEVEIWEKRAGGMHQRVIVPGTKAQYLRCLVWVGDRLFGGNLNGSLFEVDFNKTLSQIPCEVGGGGGVWSMDANKDYVLTACEDGRVRLYQPSPLGFGLDYVKSLSGGGAGRLLCIRVHGADENFCYTSGMDGAVRKWDLKAKRVVDQIVIPTSYARQVTVWSLDTYGNQLACGDSLGRVHIWNDDQSTPQTFSEHRGDVLAVTFACQGTAVFASGVDSRLAMFRVLLPERKDWVYVYSHRAHTHDVRALGLLRGEGEEVVVSGGVDTQLCWYPTTTFEKVRPRKESLYRQTPAAVSASDKLDVLLVQHTFHLDLWGVDQDAKTHVHVATINFDDDQVIRQCALSKSGKYIACILLNELHVFEHHLGDSVSIKRCAIVPKIRDAVSIVFTASESLLLVSTAQGIASLDVALGEIVNETETNSVLTNLCRSVDGQWVAGTVLSQPGAAEAVEIFNLDVMRRHELLPNSLFGLAGHAALAFSPCSKRLFVARLDGTVQAVDIDQRQLVPAAQVQTSLPERILGLTFNPAESHTIMAWSSSHASVLMPAATGVTAKPRVLKKCKPLVFASFLGEDKLFVLEAPFVNAFKFLPDVVERERYGT